MPNGPLRTPPPPARAAAVHVREAVRAVQPKLAPAPRAAHVQAAIRAAQIQSESALRGAHAQMTSAPVPPRLAATPTPAHVQAAIRADQAKAAGPPGAAHVRAAVQGAQAKLVVVPPLGHAQAAVRAALATLAPVAYASHVQVAVRTAQSKLADQPAASHVRAVVRTVQAKHAGAPRALLGSARAGSKGWGAVIQRADATKEKSDKSDKDAQAVANDTTEQDEKQAAKDKGKEKRSTRQPFKSYEAGLAKVWTTMMKAGSCDGDLLASYSKADSAGDSSSGKKEQFACWAVGYREDTSSEFWGEFKGSLHAEMAVLEKMKAAGFDPKELIRLDIETEPCPRCAVVLNALKLSDRVTYGKVGKKKAYPTWQFPNQLLKDAYELLNLEQAGLPDDGKLTMTAVNHLTTQEWWA